jgi:hypothetical protein
LGEQASSTRPISGRILRPLRQMKQISSTPIQENW